MEQHVHSEQRLQKLTERVYYFPENHETDRPVLGVIVGDQHTLIVDAGNSPYHANLLLAEIERLGLPKPTLQFLTHWHWDHTFGMSAYSLPVIAHRKTYDYLSKLVPLAWTDEAIDQRVQEGTEIEFCAEMIKKEFGNRREDIQIVLPTILFDRELTVDLGGVTCHIEHVGGDHADDSSILVVKQEGVVFLGDSSSPDIYSEQRKYTSELLLPLLDQLEKHVAPYYIYSHADPIDRNTFLQDNRESRAILSSLQKNGPILERIVEDVQPIFGRPLNDADREFVQYFINGYKG